MRILLVEDDKRMAEIVSETLESRDHEVVACHSMQQAVPGVFSERFDLIILDLILGKQRGESLVMQLRKKKIDTPILVTSALGEIVIKVNLFELGADDYLEKPFDQNELLVRAEALQRRCQKNSPQCEEEDYEGVVFDWKHNEVVRGGVRIPLTRKQGELLRLLVTSHGKTVKTEDILQKIWKVRSGYHSNIVQSMIRRLRRQLDTGFPHKLIRNVHGVGYSLVLPETEEELQVEEFASSMS